MRFIASALCIAAVAALCFGDQAVTKPQVTGYGFLEGGQIYKGMTKYFQGPVQHVWMERFVGGLGLTLEPTAFTKVIVGGEAEVAYSYAPIRLAGDTRSFSTRQPRYTYYPTQAEGLCLLGDSTRNSLLFEVGYFPFKYDAQVRNLGEYLFRTWSYPTFLDNSFDKAFARLLGLRINGTLFGKIRQDVLLTSETERYPLQDFSVSYLAGFRQPKMIDIGAGVSLDRLLPASDVYTTPKDKQNNLFIRNPDTLTDSYGLDSIVGDTGYYSFAGTKLMARVSIDCRGLLELAGVPVWMFGEEDLKVYGEAALLGYTNYPRYYEKRSQRLPRMFGVNLPTHPLAAYGLVPGMLAAWLSHDQGRMFRIDKSDAYAMAPAVLCGAGVTALEYVFHRKFRLDVLSLECEFSEDPYINSYDQILHVSAPIPLVTPSGAAYKVDKWRWSVFAQKKLLNTFEVTAQVARDHMRPLMFSYDQLETSDALPARENWWWILKVKCGL